MQLSSVPSDVHLPGASHADHGSSGHPIKDGYFAATAEEAEKGTEHPVDVERLTALLLVVFVGAALGLLLGGKLLLGRSSATRLTGECLPRSDRPSPQRPAAPLLSVFRL